MNRERVLFGTNGYSYELRYDLHAFLHARLENESVVRWLDVCSGTGAALIEAASAFHGLPNLGELEIDGVDVAGHFLRPTPELKLRFHKTPIEHWAPHHKYDLITCVHGLHYIGDKLGVIQSLAESLSDQGMFLANIDLSNLKYADGRNAGRFVVKRLRSYGFQYESKQRRMLLTSQDFSGPIDWELEYLGADDTVGPNYTGQGAVDSIYASTNSLRSRSPAA